MGIYHGHSTAYEGNIMYIDLLWLDSEATPADHLDESRQPDFEEQASELQLFGPIPPCSPCPPSDETALFKPLSLVPILRRHRGHLCDGSP
jgi:hypothetical protein